MAEPDEKPEKPAEGKKGEKPAPSRLELTAKEGTDFLSSATNTGLATANLAATGLLGLGPLAFAASYPLSGLARKRNEGKPFTAADLRDESIKGAVGASGLYFAATAAQNLAKSGLESTVMSAVPAPLVAGGLTLAAMPLINLFYQPVKYIIENKKIDGLANYMKENYWKDTKQYLTYFGIPAAAMVGAATAIPAFAPYLFPALAVWNLLYRGKSLNPLKYVPNPFPVVTGIASVGAKTITGVYETARAVGSSLYSTISNLFKSAPPAQAPPAPAPKPA
ncbi:hypothetical protein HYX02_04510 [Candidatus Woesearchaeota archaeon]|nr:hypothetical protein [Candidatus Woesearchaeota archaeon]